MEPDRPSTAAAGVEALLGDGSVVTVRPVTGADRPGLMELNHQASERSRRMRFFASGAQLGEQYTKHLVEATDGHLAVVAERCGELIGVASAEPVGARPVAPAVFEAEVGLLVSDRWQHTGVGTLLLEHLSAAARAAGIMRFSAVVLTENADMFDVFVHAGFDLQFEAPDHGQVAVALDLRGTRALAAAVAERERRSGAASIAPLLSPHSVVVIGASRRAGTVGHVVLGNLRAKSFTGRLAAVNRNVVDGEHINGVLAHRSVRAVPWRPDLAVIAVPADQVAEVLESCGAAGVRGAVVISAGFAETGNQDGQLELVRIAHRYGIRLVGPNCLGVLNTDPTIRLDATFARTTPRAGEHGGIGLAAQSGALGIAVLDAAGQRGLGISSFVSLGNKADVSADDMLLYWAGDPRTQVIALYLESIGNPRRFRRIAAAVSRTKPIVVLSGGRSVAGPRAGASHSAVTAAAATPDAVTRALFRDAGVIAVDTTSELADVAALLAVQPVPGGRRVVVLGNAGGSGALAADSACSAGAEVPRLSAETVAGLRAVAPDAPGLDNPVDLGGAATAKDYLAALNIVLNSGEADAVVIAHVETRAEPEHCVIAAVELAEYEAKQSQGTRSVTMAGALIGSPPPRGGRLPWYGSVEAAAHAIGRAGDLGRWRAHGPVPPVGPDEAAIPAGIDSGAVRELIESADRSPEGWLPAAAVAEVLRLIGVPVSPTTNGQDADPGSLELMVRLATPAEGVPVAMVAAAGPHEELLADRVLGTLPLAPGGAAAMVSRLRFSALLDGCCGRPALDRQAVIDVLERIAALDTIAPQLRELDLNPLVVSESGVTALEAKIRVAVPGEPARRRDPVRDDYEQELG